MGERCRKKCHFFTYVKDYNIKSPYVQSLSPVTYKISKCYIKHAYTKPSGDTTDISADCNTAPIVSVVAQAKCSTYDPNECRNDQDLKSTHAIFDCVGDPCAQADENTCCEGPASRCELNQHVIDSAGVKECSNCAPGKTRTVSDSTHDGLTDCISTLCKDDGSERVKDYACVACVDDTTFAAPSGDASGDNTECYAPFGDFSGQEVAKLKNLVGGSTIDAGTEQTCLKARYNAIAGCSSSTSAYSRL